MQLLDVSYEVRLDSAQRALREDGSISHSFPFFFVIPLGTEGLGASKPLLCRILPPTFRSKGLYSDSISVTYKLHGVVRYRNEQDASSEIPQTARKVEKSQNIDFLPYFEVQPPTHVASFPGEFVLKRNSPIRK